MKQTSFKIPIYDIEVNLVKIERQSDANLIDNVLRQEDIPLDLVREITDNTANSVEGAITLFDKGKKRAFIVFYKSDNKAHLMRSLCHEKRHLEDDVVALCNINKDDEAVAYLAGYLGELFFNFLLMK